MKAPVTVLVITPKGETKTVTAIDKQKSSIAIKALTLSPAAKLRALHALWDKLYSQSTNKTHFTADQNAVAAAIVKTEEEVFQRRVKRSLKPSRVGQTPTRKGLHGPRVSEAA